MTEHNINTVPVPDAYRRRLGEMLDLTYELEGLLHIGISRSSVPPRLNQLIVDKLNAIVALADEPARPEEYDRPEIVSEGAEEYAEEYKETYADDEPESEETEEYTEQYSETPGDEKTGPEVSEDFASSYSVIVEDEGEITEELPAEDTVEEPEEIKVEEPDEIKTETIEEDSEYKGNQDPDTEEKTDVREVRFEENMRPKGGRLFSVNDRFLYARELFGGNLKNFDKAIDGVITLDNYDEAEEYFVGEWGIDAESPTGMRFLATIMKMF